MPWYSSAKNQVSLDVMGQPVTVVEKRASQRGVIRLEANRTLSGTGHLSYRGPSDVLGDTPADKVAQLLFEQGKVDGVHINGNVITIDLKKGADSAGMKELVESLFLYYR